MFQSKPVRILLFVAIAALFLCGIIITIRQNVLLPGPYDPPTPEPATPAPATPTAGSSPSATPTAGSSPAPTPTIPPTLAPLVDLEDPVKIYFNDADPQVACEIRPVGITPEGAMGAISSATIAGWYKDGVSPGEAGNALIDGHVRWKGKTGTFSILKDMVPGDEVAIEYADGTFQYFETVSVDIYLLEEVPPEVMELDFGGEPRITLISCLGDYDRSLGTSRSRVIVVCRRKNV